MVVGDSVINGGSLTDQSQLATTVLGEALHRKVVNVSAGSWGPGNYAAYLKKFGTFGAQYLVIEMNSHDVWEDDPSTSAGSTVGIEISQPDHKPWCATWELLDRYLMPRVKKCLGMGRGPMNKVDVARWDNVSESSERNNREKFAYICSLNVPKKALLVWRSRAEAENDEESDGEKIMKGWAMENNVPVIHVLSEVSDYRDKIHPNAGGQKKIASAIESWIKDNE